jgi:hypothetical protein
VNGIHGKSGEADSDVLGSAFMGSGITDPLASVSDYSLSGGDFERAGPVFYAKRALKDDSELVKGRSLAGFEPSRGAAHVGHACRCSLGVDASNVLIDELGFIAGGLYARGLRN